jgi:hypothetical protein
MHAALHSLMKPVLEAAGVFIQPGGFGDATILEPKLPGPLPDQNGMLAA